MKKINQHGHPLSSNRNVTFRSFSFAGWNLQLIWFRTNLIQKVQQKSEVLCRSYSKINLSELCHKFVWLWNKSLEYHHSEMQYLWIWGSSVNHFVLAVWPARIWGGFVPFFSQSWEGDTCIVWICNIWSGNNSLKLRFNLTLNILALIEGERYVMSTALHQLWLDNSQILLIKFLHLLKILVKTSNKAQSVKEETAWHIFLQI